MRLLQDSLRYFSGRGVSLRVEQPENKLFLSCSTGVLNSTEVATIKANKPLLILILPEGKSFGIEHLLYALDCCIERSVIIQSGSGIDIHGADLQSISDGRAYLESVDSETT